GAEGDGRSGGCSRAFAGCAGRPAQSAAPADEGGVASGVAGGEFEGQARALGKAEQGDALGADAVPCELRDERSDYADGGRETWFAARNGGEKRVRIQGVARSLRRHVRNVVESQLVG